MKLIGEKINDKILEKNPNDIMGIAQILLFLTTEEKEEYMCWLTDNILMKAFDEGRTFFYEKDINPYWIVLELLDRYHYRKLFTVDFDKYMR